MSAHAVTPITTPETCPARDHVTRHSTMSDYKYGCRCFAAREANRIYYKRRREGRLVPNRVDSTGTRRRIHALMAIGWTAALIGARLGIRGESLQQMLLRRQVLRSTANRVATLYNELSGHPGPSPYVVGIAVANRWPAPAMWDDDTIDDPSFEPPDDVPDLGPTSARRAVDPVAVERAIAGDPPAPFARVDRLEAVRQLATTVNPATGEPYNYQEIARRMRLHPRQVDRDIADLALRPRPQPKECAA